MLRPYFFKNSIVTYYRTTWNDSTPFFPHKDYFNYLLGSQKKLDICFMKLYF